MVLQNVYVCIYKMLSIYLHRYKTDNDKAHIFK